MKKIWKAHYPPASVDGHRDGRLQSALEPASRWLHPSRSKQANPRFFIGGPTGNTWNGLDVSGRGFKIVEPFGKNNVVMRKKI